MVFQTLDDMLSQNELDEGIGNNNYDICSPCLFRVELGLESAEFSAISAIVGIHLRSRRGNTRDRRAGIGRGER